MYEIRYHDRFADITGSIDSLENVVLGHKKIRVILELLELAINITYSSVHHAR